MAVFATVSLYLLLLYIAIVDFRFRRISNGAVAMVALNATLLFFLEDQQSALGIFVNLVLLGVIFMPGYLRGLVGAGDIKLFAGLALCWPPLTLLWVLASGMVLTVFFFCGWGLISSDENRPAPTGNASQQSHLALLQRRIPLGTAVFAGTITHQYLARLFH